MTSMPDIDAIVREVLSRLAPAMGSSSVAPARKAGDVKPTLATAAIAGELRLSERVITLDVLRGRLQGVKRVSLAGKALVTPAARDELQEKKIEVVRSDAAAPTSGGKASSLVVAAIGRYEAAGLARQLSAGEPQSHGDLPAALAALAGPVAGGSRVLLLCDRPAKAVCEANGQGALRAAWAVDVDSAREAVETAGANVLVLQPSRHSFMQMVNIGRAFRRAQPLTN